MRYFKNSLLIMICCVLTLSVASCASKSVPTTKAAETKIEDTSKEESKPDVTEQQEEALQSSANLNTAAAAAGVLFQAPTDYYIELDGSGILAGDITGMISDMDADEKFESFEISQGSPNVTNALAVVGDYAINTVENFGAGSLFDANGDLNTNCYIQMTCFDLDGDKIQELIVSAGNKSTEMETLVYFFDEAKQSFSFAGSIIGQKSMYFEDGTINVPTGTDGLIEQYTYSSGSISHL